MSNKFIPYQLSLFPQVYDNGSVHFNDGSLSIVVLNVTKNDGAHFFYDSEMSNPHYFNNQKRYVKCLLNMAMEDFNLRHMFIVTWKNYSFHDESQVCLSIRKSLCNCNCSIILTTDHISACYSIRLIYNICLVSLW